MTIAKGKTRGIGSVLAPLSTPEAQAILEAAMRLDNDSDLMRIRAACQMRAMEIRRTAWIRLAHETWARYANFKPGTTVWCTMPERLFMTGTTFQRGDKAKVVSVDTRHRSILLQFPMAWHKAQAQKRGLRGVSALVTRAKGIFCLRDPMATQLDLRTVPPAVEEVAP